MVCAGSLVCWAQRTWAHDPCTIPPEERAETARAVNGLPAPESAFRKKLGNAALSSDRARKQFNRLLLEENVAKHLDKDPHEEGHVHWGEARAGVS